MFYEFEGRKYCEHDFHVLYAPCCGKCSEFIVGRVIRAMSATWHPQCFTCELCKKELADQGWRVMIGEGPLLKHKIEPSKPVLSVHFTPVHVLIFGFDFGLDPRLPTTIRVSSEYMAGPCARNAR